MHPERDVPFSLYQTLGFAVLTPPSRGDRKERPIVGQVETLDRLAGHLHSLFRSNADFIQPDGLDKQLGCDDAMVRRLMFAFGYVPSRLSAAEAAALAAESSAKAEAAAPSEEQNAEAASDAVPETAPAEEATAPETAPAADAEEPKPEEPKTEEASAEAEASAETPASEEAPADLPVWTRRGRGAGRPSKPQQDRAPKAEGDKPSGPRQGKKGKGKGPRPPKSSGGPKNANKPMDPNSPFAVLAQLKK
jgi:ATP-dependent RNA helicase SUPV3L1/SUV3